MGQPLSKQLYTTAILSLFFERSERVCYYLRFASPKEKFENGFFILKTHQMFSIHTTPEVFRNKTIIRHFGLRKSRSEKSRDYRDVIAQEKLRFWNVFVHTKTESRRFKSPPKSVFENLRFPDGLMWTVGLAVETKLCFHISPAWCRRRPRFIIIKLITKKKKNI